MSHVLRCKHDSVEQSFLLLCVQPAHDDRYAERVHQLVDRISDWQYLLECAERHRIVPLLARALQSFCSLYVPVSVLQELRRQSNSIAFHNLMLTGELLRLLKLFAQQDINVISMKGPALAVEAYGNLALRQFGDLDLLFHDADVLRVKDFLIAEGYQPLVHMTDTQEQLFIDQDNDFAFVHSERGIRLELHTAIKPKFYAFHLDHEVLWADRVSMQVQGQAVDRFAPADQMLTLCIHGASHSWERLCWICDIAQLLHHYRELDWFSLLNKARGLGCLRMLLLGPLLAHKLLNASLPEVVVEAISQDSAVSMLADRVCSRLFADVEETVEGAEQFWFYIHIRERWRDRVQYILRLAVDPNIHDWSLIHLPQSLTFFYYLVRPFRLVGVGLASLSRAVQMRRFRDKMRLVE